MAKKIRGVRKEHELSSNKDLRDIRTFGEKFRDSLEKGDMIIIITIAAIGMMWLMPQIIEFTALGTALFLMYASNIYFPMPFRVPLAAGAPDPSMHRGKAKGKLRLSEGSSSDIQTDIHAKVS